jgi:N-acetylglucosamine-6-sulfatase
MKFTRWLLALLASVVCTLAAAEGQPKPNILFVLVDDLDNAGWQVGLDQNVLPNIKQYVIDKGTTFDEMFVSQSMCCPSRATLMTGQYPHNHGVVRNGGPMGGMRHFDDASTVSLWMQNAGYRTGIVGKYLNGYDRPYYVPPGWDTWNVLTAGSTYCMYNYTLSVNGQATKTYGDTPADYQTDVLAAYAERFINQSKTDPKPFFLEVTTVAPHLEDCLGDGDDDGKDIRPAPRHVDTVNVKLPAASLASFNEADMSDKPRWMRNSKLLDEKSEKKVFNHKVESMRAVDDLVGTLAAALKRVGRDESTLIIVASDNGYQYGTHRRQSKISLYEESIRVPMVIRAPGQQEARRTSEWVLNNDWGSTIVAAGGATAGLPMDGRSLIDLINGVQGAKGRRSILVEMPSDGVFAKKNPPYYMIRSKDPALTGDLTEKQILVYAETFHSVNGSLLDVEFYDMAIDPLQLTSFHDSTLPRYVQQRAALKAQLDQLKVCKDGGCKPLEN